MSVIHIICRYVTPYLVVRPPLCAAPIPTFALVRKLKVKGRTNDATRRAQAPVTGTGLLVERSHTSARSPRRALTHQETATCFS